MATIVLNIRVRMRDGRQVVLGDSEFGAFASLDAADRSFRLFRKNVEEKQRYPQVAAIEQAWATAQQGGALVHAF